MFGSDPARLFLVEDEETQQVADADPGDPAVGALGEAKAIAELLKRGHRVARPVVDDDGVDLIIDYRLIAQVKTTRQAVLRDGARKGWQFKCTTQNSIDRAARRGAGRMRIAPHVDIVLCHALDIDAWWIIPAEAIRDVYGIVILPGRKLDLWRDNWSILQRD